MTQYSKKVDAIIYGAAADFSRAELIMLAFAALDQSHFFLDSCTEASAALNDLESMARKAEEDEEKAEGDEK